MVAAPRPRRPVTGRLVPRAALLAAVVVLAVEPVAEGAPIGRLGQTRVARVADAIPPAARRFLVGLHNFQAGPSVKRDFAILHRIRMIPRWRDELRSFGRLIGSRTWNIPGTISPGAPSNGRPGLEFSGQGRDYSSRTTEVG